MNYSSSKEIKDLTSLGAVSFRSVSAPRSLSFQERNAILDQQLIMMTSHGSQVLTHGDSWAVVTTGRPLNHVLHLLLSVFTCGFWVLVWLLMTAFAGNRQTTVHVNEYGEVFFNQAPMQPHRIIAIVIAVFWVVLQMVFFVSCVSSLASYDDEYSALPTGLQITTNFFAA